MDSEVGGGGGHLRSANDKQTKLSLPKNDLFFTHAAFPFPPLNNYLQIQDKKSIVYYGETVKSETAACE